MSNSATSAAKRRRAAPFLSSPVLQQQSDNSRVINNVAATQQQPEQKMLTLQQVISLVDSRLTNLEKNVIDMKSQPQTAVSTNAAPSSIDKESLKPEVEAILFEYLSEFDERYELLANEIADLKNIVLGLQSYTMNVNKVLMEERLQSVTESASVEQVLQDNVVLVESQSQTEESIVAEEEVVDTSTEVLEETATLEESTKSAEEQLDVTIVAKSQKKKGSNKKSQVTLDQEY
jgi:hypothetical protein